LSLTRGLQSTINRFSYFTSTASGGGSDLHFYIEELGPGETFISASGANYLPLSSVPEAPAWALMLVGLDGVGGIRGAMRGSRRRQFGPIAAA
jgi:hypothetical protein